MSLIEAVVATVIVGTMMVAALTAMGSFAQAGRVQSARCRGEHLARQLLDEILQAYYADPTETPTFGREPSEGATSRDTWDDVDDYNGWSESPPQAKDGTPLAGAEGWTRRVVVEYVDPSDPSLPTRTDQGLKRITVTAVSPDGKETRLQVLRSDSGAYDMGPQAQAPCVSWVGVELQIGPSSATRIISGTHVLNAVAEP